jgi:hypothetical protein
VYDAHLARHLTPEQLRTWFENDIMSVSPFPSAWPDGLTRAARAAYPTLMACRPDGWRLMDAAGCAEFMHSEVLPCIDDISGTILPSRAAGIPAASKKYHESAGWFSVAKLESAFSTVSMLAKAARHQAQAREVVLWCAIERFQLKHGHLPDRLEELTPGFLEKLPCDPVNGLPLKYVKKGDRGYLLYSIGWNGKDDGGVERKAKEQGDWVWASDPRLIVNPDEEKLKAEAEMEAGAKNERAKRKAEREAESQKAMAKRNAPFRAKEEANKREREELAKSQSKK